MKKICGIILLSVCYLIMLVFVNVKICDYLDSKDEKLRSLAIRNLMTIVQQDSYAEWFMQTYYYSTMSSYSAPNLRLTGLNMDYYLDISVASPGDSVLDTFYAMQINVIHFWNNYEGANIYVITPSEVACTKNNSLPIDRLCKIAMELCRDQVDNVLHTIPGYNSNVTSNNILHRIEYAVQNEYYSFVIDIDKSSRTTMNELYGPPVLNAGDWMVYFNMDKYVGNIQQNSKKHDDWFLYHVIIYGIIAIVTIGTFVILKKRKRRGK